MPTEVSPMITDTAAPTQMPVSPAIALANLYQTNAQSLAIAAQNAVSAQQEANSVLLSTTARAVAQLFARQ
jgi:hypothetical protein